MNWNKIYIDLINSRKNRKIKADQYYESHHIIPDFMFKNRSRKGPSGHLPGNPNDKSNFIKLTPREHILSHLILCKIYRNTRYEYPCLSSVMLMLSHSSTGSKLSINRKFLNETIGKIKLYSEFKKKACKAISSARKGKIVCKDSNTGEIIGSIDKTHPNIISGKWIHHSKGNQLSYDHIQIIKKRSTGLSNANSRGYTDEQLIESYVKCCNDFGFIVTYPIWIKYCQKYNLPYLKHFKKFRFNGGGFTYLRERAEEITGMVYIDKQYIRKETKEKYYNEIKKWL